jgi:hypothetical protein
MTGKPKKLYKPTKAKTPQPVAQLPLGFTPELLDLGSAARHACYLKLSHNPNAGVFCAILHELGFRNTEDRLTLIRDHVVYPVSEQDIRQTLHYLLQGKSAHETNSIYRSSSSLINRRALRFINKEDPVTDGHRLWHHARSMLFPFLNGLLKITSDEISLIPYRELDILVPVETVI